jgi:kumamolisin
VTLDIEVAGAIAPGATIVVYFTPDASAQSFLDAITQAVHDTQNNPSVISISWGGPESVPEDDFMNQFDQALQAAALLGITVCVAAGDNGAAGEVPSQWDGAAHVDFPASSPNALACGGTLLEGSGGTITSESTWNDHTTAQDSFGAGGGGVSDAFPLPSWQQSANVPNSLSSGHPGRGVPDVCGNADPNSGYNILMTINGEQQAFPVGGTGAVAPLWAGLIARINQQLGRRVGYVNLILYGLGASAGAFQDITTGNNRVGPNYLGYDAGPGWDPCTGLGSPNGTALLTALANALGGSGQGSSSGQVAILSGRRPRW